MVRTYFTQPQARWCEALGCETIDLANAMTVFEPEPITRRTGLLDKDSAPIMVREQIDAIGFVRFSR